MKNSCQSLALLVVLCAVMSAPLSAASGTAILLQNGPLNLAENADSYGDGYTVPLADIHQGRYYRLLQFHQIPDAVERQQLAQAGVVLLDYIPHRAYIASIGHGFDLNRLPQFGVRSIYALQAADKSDRYLRQGQYPDWTLSQGQRVFLTIVLQRDAEWDQALQGLLDVAEEIHEIHGDNTALTLEIEKHQVPALLALPFVKYAEVLAPPAKPEDTPGRSLHRSNVLDSEYGAGRKYDGTGVSIAINDDGFVGPHIDFHGRTDQSDVAGDLAGDHGDMVAGIAGGAGNVDPTIQGMAPGAFLWIRQYVSTLPNTVTLHQNNQVMLFSSSYSNGCNAGYTSTTELVDMQIASNTSLIQTFSAGNSNNADCGYGAGNQWGNVTGGHKIAKNVIAVANLFNDGSLVSSSSRGPASDGRVKPDISSHGQGQLSTDPVNAYAPGGGTSAAAPGIAGITAQLYHAYRSLNAGADPESGLLKACLLNTADEKGNAGPDFKFGWGRVNAKRAVETLEDNRYFDASVAQGGSNNHTITVPAGTQQLRVMVYWMEPAASTIAAKALVNNLDMTLLTPGGSTLEPWVLDPTPDPVLLDLPAVRGVDTLNNVEQVTLDAPAAGNYTLTVNGTELGAGPQKYYVVYEFVTDQIHVTYPIGGESLVAGESQIIRFDALGTANTFTVEYSTDGGVNWILIGNPAGTLREITWTVPAVETADALIRASRPGNTTGQSVAAFSVYPVPANLSIDAVCPTTTELSWDSVAGAVAYDVFMLGTMYMDSVLTTAATSVIIAGTDVNNEDWFAVRARGPNGELGRRSLAVQRIPGILSCPVDNDIAVDAVLSPAPGTLPNCLDLTSVIVTVRISNPGIQPQTNFPVSYTLNGGLTVSEVFAGTLTSGQSVDYAFAGTINISAPGTYTIIAVTSLTNDSLTYNDTLETQTLVIGGSSITPSFAQDFESQSNCATTTNCEATMCNLSGGWINGGNGAEDDVDWRVNSGGTPSANTGPTVDHSTGSGSGKYVYLETSGGCNGKAALLMSPCIDLSALTNISLSFWYHMFGTAMGELHLDIFDGSGWTMDAIPPIVGNQGDLWQEATLSLTSYAGSVIQLRFRGITGTDFTSDMALDDIRVLDLDAAPVAAFSSSPQIVCLSENVQFSDESANLPTSWAWSFNPATVTFVNGTSAASQNPVVRFNQLGTYDVTLIVSNANAGDTLTKIADITVGNGVTLPFAEDMESFGLCGTTANCAVEVCTLGNNWKNLSNGSADDIDWRTNSGTTPSTGTGPSVDHSLGTTVGRYLYIETSGSCNGQTAILESPCIDVAGITNPVLSFWYHMLGSNMGSLHVDVLTGTVWTQDVITPIAGDQGNVWLERNVSLLPHISGNSTMIRIRAVSGTGFESDIAIDDILLKDVIAAPTADFEGDKTYVCAGQVVTLNDKSIGTASSWLWTIAPTNYFFVNGTNSNSQNPQVVFAINGSYTVTLDAGNVIGTDNETKNAYITVAGGIGLPVIEDFELAFPPASWCIINGDAPAATWTSATVTGSDGTTTTAAAMQNYSYNGPTQEDGLQTIPIDLSLGSLVGAELVFDVAYAYYDATLFDGLRVDVSTDCGATFDSTDYKKFQDVLATVPATTANFSPAAASDWRRDTVDLTAYIGQQILVRFVNINGYGNNLYLDNISVDEKLFLGCDVPTGLNVSVQSTLNAVSLNWTSVPNAVQYIIRGKAVNAASFAFLTVPAGGGPTTGVGVTGLSATTAYHWQVKAICDGSLESAFSQFDTFMTSQGLTCDAPAMIWTDNITTTSARLNWTATPNVFRYQLQGRQIGTGGGVTLNVSPPAVSFDASSLLPATGYEWWIRTRCDQLNTFVSSFTPLTNFTTLGPSVAKPVMTTTPAFQALVFPNPMTETAVLQFHNPMQDPYSIRLTDMSGRIVLQVEGFRGDRYIIEKGPLSTGLYLWTLTGPNQARGSLVID